MKYADLKKNDVVDCPEGICVSFWVQGCPIKCPGCHNPGTWDFDGGKEFTIETLQEIIDAIDANGIKRSFSILGGEPLCQENQFLTWLVIDNVKKRFPNIKIYLWTGYYLKNLVIENRLKDIIMACDTIIEGPFIFAERDITLPLRGSRNQNIIRVKDLNLT